MRCVRRMTGNSLIERIKNEDLRKILGTEAAIAHIKRQQINWFGHVIRQENKQLYKESSLRNMKTQDQHGDQQNHGLQKT
jgi:hypothetical protein